MPLLEDFYADYYAAAGIALASCLAMCLAVRVLGRRGGLLLFMILTALASLLQLGLLNREWAGPGAVGRPGAPLSSLNPCTERPPDELPLERAATAPGVWGLFCPDPKSPHCPKGMGSLLLLPWPRTSPLSQRCGVSPPPALTPSLLGSPLLLP